MIKHTLPGLILLCFFGCTNPTEESSLQEDEFSITLTSPASLGFDSLELKKMTAKIENQEFPNLHSVLIVKDGHLFYEEYFTGQDYNYGEDLGIVQHSDTTLHDVRSISKSVISACVGIAIKNGYLENVDQKISAFFPEYDSIFTGKKAEWTLFDFLTMTTGLDWKEDIPYSDPENDELQMYYAENPVEYVLSKAVVDYIGTAFNYCGGATQVLAKIVEKSSGTPILEFVRIHLFEPLGIDHFEWNEYPGSGEIGAASGLRITSRDLLKIGMLYRNKGQWNGEHLLPEQWVEDSFARQVSFPSPVYDGDDYYGYQFWIWDDAVGDVSFEIVSATGNGDQHIYWDTKNDIMIITTAGNYNQWDIRNNSAALYKSEIYPLIPDLISP